MRLLSRCGRWAVVRSGILLAALACGSGPLAAQAPDRSAVDVRHVGPDPAGVFTFERLDRGVWVARVRDRPEAYAFANSLVVVGDDGVLVVDTQQSPSAARALVDRIRIWTDRPVRWVVNTHWHGDHVYGNAVYRDAFPNVRFLAAPATIEGMRGPGAEQRAAELASLPGSIADRESWLDQGRLPDGRELDDNLRAQVAYSARLRRGYLDELRTLDVVEPEGWIDRPRTLDLGGRTVELVPLGPAHTAGDVVVRVPDAGVVAVGDLLEATAAPWIDGAASLTGWGAALEALAGMPETIRVPSHGDVQRDGWLLEGERALFESLLETAERGVAEAWSADRIERAELPGDHGAFMARIGVDADAFGRWRAEALARAVREARRRVRPGESGSDRVAPDDDGVAHGGKRLR